MFTTLNCFPLLLRSHKAPMPFTRYKRNFKILIKMLKKKNPLVNPSVDWLPQTKWLLKKKTQSTSVAFGSRWQARRCSRAPTRACTLACLQRGCLPALQGRRAQALRCFCALVSTVSFCPSWEQSTVCTKILQDVVTLY
jgi:hypothetical protein